MCCRTAIGALGSAPTGSARSTYRRAISDRIESPSASRGRAGVGVNPPHGDRRDGAPRPHSRPNPPPSTARLSGSAFSGTSIAFLRGHTQLLIPLAGLDPAIHARIGGVDARVEPAQGELEIVSRSAQTTGIP